MLKKEKKEQLDKMYRITFPGSRQKPLRLLRWTVVKISGPLPPLRLDPFPDQCCLPSAPEKLGRWPKPSVRTLNSSPSTWWPAITALLRPESLHHRRHDGGSRVDSILPACVRRRAGGQWCSEGELERHFFFVCSLPGGLMESRTL